MAPEHAGRKASGNGHSRVLNVLLAFFAAPFLALLLTSPVAAACDGNLRGWGLYFGFGLLFAYAATLLFAVPLYVLTARTIRPVRLWHCVCGGFVTGAAFCLVAPFPSIGLSMAFLAPSAFSVATGAIAGAMFWQVRRVLDAEDLKRRELKRGL